MKLNPYIRSNIRCGFVPSAKIARNRFGFTPVAARETELVSRNRP